MEHFISISEIIGNVRDGAREGQVCATADTEYDNATSSVRVTLDSFVRPLPPSGNGTHAEPWLPAPENVSEHLPRGEVSEFTRDVFKKWVRQVREAIPPALAT